MKDVLVISIIVSICLNLNAQDYKSIIMVDDTITESANNIVYHNDYIYTMSLTRCQPEAQSCPLLRKFDINLELIWSLYLPEIRKSNENGINVLNDSTLIIVGRNNILNLEQAFYHYHINTDGQILDFIEHPLPYESNITYGSHVHNNVLYMYGASRQFLSTPGIDVDALISTYDFESNIRFNDYFDYGNNFYVDIYDLQNNTDSTLLFISRRRNFEYGSERDYVIEEIQPDGSRKEFYNIKVPNESGIENKPSLEVLSDGRIAFSKPHESDFGFARTTRILEADGSFSHDVVIWEEYFPDFIEIYSMTATQDGGFVLVGRYFDRTEAENESKISGMLLKIDQNGDFSWVRQYKHYHNITDEPETSILYDVKELPNSDLVATGNVSNSTSDLWILKVDSEGCFGEGDCGETTVGIDENIIQTNYVNIYPNPVAQGDELQVEVSSQVSGTVDYRITGLNGGMIKQGEVSSGINSISMIGMPAGIYALSLDLGRRGVENHKVVVL